MNDNDFTDEQINDAAIGATANNTVPAGITTHQENTEEVGEQVGAHTGGVVVPTLPAPRTAKYRSLAEWNKAAIQIFKCIQHGCEVYEETLIIQAFQQLHSLHSLKPGGKKVRTWPEAVGAVEPEKVAEDGVRRAVKAIKRGEFRTAMKSLNATPIAAPTEANIQQMAELHPSRYDDDDPFDELQVPAETRQAVLEMSVTDQDVAAYINSRPKGSAGGNSGWTFDLLRELMAADAVVLQGTTAFVVTMLLGDAPDEIRHLLVDAKGVMLEKGNGKIRPIAIGEVFYRIASGVLTAKLASKIRTALGDDQFGAPSQPAGTETMAAFIKAYLQAHPTHVALSVDCKNAFNCISRAAIAEGISMFPNLKALIPLTKFAYRGRSHVRLSNGHEIVSEEGARQGDPLGPVLFCLGLRYATRDLPSLIPNCVLPKYMDDMMILGTLSEVSSAFEIVQASLNAVHLEVNPSKCSIFGPQLTPEMATAEAGDLIEGGVKLALGGMVIVGVPIGSESYIRHWCQDEVTAIIGQLEPAIKSVYQKSNNSLAQSLFQLIRICLPAKANHICRSVPPPLCTAAMQRLDKVILELVYDVCNIAAVADPAAAEVLRDQVQLAAGLGGLGIRSLEKTADAAFVGSWSLVYSRVAALVPKVKEGVTGGADGACRKLGDAGPELLPCVEDMDNAFKRLGEKGCLPEDLSYDDLLAKPIRGVQHKVATMLEERLKKDLLGRLSGSQKTSFLGAAGNYAHAWVLCIPRNPTTTLSREAFQFAVRQRLHLPLLSSRQQGLKCHKAGATPNTVVDDNHILGCSLTSKTLRHNAVQAELFDIAKTCGAEPSQDKARLNPTRQWPAKPAYHLLPAAEDGDAYKLLADIELSNLQTPCGRSHLIDVTVVSPDAKATTLHQNKSGVAAEIAEKDKREHYTKYVAYNPEAIIPFAAERTGALGEQAVDLLTTLAKKKYPPVIAVDENGQEKAILSRQCLFQRYRFIERISIAIQLANYLMFTASVKTHRRGRTPLVGGQGIQAQGGGGMQATAAHEEVLQLLAAATDLAEQQADAAAAATMPTVAFV